MIFKKFLNKIRPAFFKGAKGTDPWYKLKRSFNFDIVEN